MPKSQTDTPNKCKRILDDAGFTDYDETTPPFKLRLLAAGILAKNNGLTPEPALLSAIVANGLPNLDKLAAVVARCNNEQSHFDVKKNGWVNVRAFIGEVKQPFLCKRHGSAETTRCNGKGRVNNNMCVDCKTPCINPISDYFGTITLIDWDHPNETVDINYATSAGTQLFRKGPNIMAMKTAAELTLVPLKMNMLPYKITVRVQWDVQRNEVSLLIMQFRAIDTECSAVTAAPTMLDYLGKFP